MCNNNTREKKWVNKYNTLQKSKKKINRLMNFSWPKNTLIREVKKNSSSK